MLSRRPSLIGILLTVVLVSIPSTRADSELGFGVRVEDEGFFLNPVVTKIPVTNVKKASVADAAGIRARDITTKIEDRRVVGRRAKELQPLMDFSRGETRTLTPSSTRTEQSFTREEVCQGLNQRRLNSL